MVSATLSQVGISKDTSLRLERVAGQGGGGCAGVWGGVEVGGGDKEI